MKNVVCIVQARMGSERLPGKSLKPILDKPMLYYTIKRLQQCQCCDDIVVATTIKDIDNDIEDMCREYGFNCFRGSEDNVLERYIMAGKFYNADVIVRVTGDCPLIEPTLVDKAIKQYLDSDVDYVRTDVPNSCIRGFDVEVVSLAELEKIKALTDGCEALAYDKFREHVTYYITQHEKDYKTSIVEIDDIYNRDYRLCVDTQSDFDVVEKVYNHFKDELVKGKDIVEFLDDNPDIAYLNKDVKQRI